MSLHHARDVPAGACDSHTHVFAPPEAFPFAHPPSYAPPRAPVELHRHTAGEIGIARGIVVQPTPYGANPDALIDALRRASGSLRAIAVAEASASDEALGRMASVGIRGLRFVEVRLPDGSPYRGAVGLDGLEALAPRIKPLGWHAEIWAPLSTVLGRRRQIERIGIPVVLDHMGGFDVSLGTGHDDFQQLLAMVREGSIWVKLVLCRRVEMGADLGPLRPFHDALIEANPGRLLWGSDWPFVRMGSHAPDIGELLDLFVQWSGDRAIVERILVTNPCQRYGFDTPRAATSA